MSQVYFNEFRTILDSYKNEICGRISETYGIDKHELLSVCDTHTSDKPALKTTPIRSGQPKKKQNKCIYVFMKGCKKGQECGVGVPAGSRYCAKHSTKDRKPKDLVQIDPQTDKHHHSILECLNKAVQNQPSSPRVSDIAGSESDDAASDVVSESCPDSASDVSAEYQITKNKYGNYMDEETGFVFSDDSTVYGKQEMDTGAILELDEEEISIVESCGWDYIPQ